MEWIMGIALLVVGVAVRMILDLFFPAVYDQIWRMACRREHLARRELACRGDPQAWTRSDPTSYLRDLGGRSKRKGETPQLISRLGDEIGRRKA